MSPLSPSPRDLLSSSPQGGRTLTKEQYQSLLSSTERKILGLSFTGEHPERVTLGLSAGEALTESLIQSTLTPHFWQSIGITHPPAIASIALLPGGEAHVSLGNGKTMIIEGTTAPLGAILMQLQSMKTLETLQTLFRETGLTVFTPAGKPPVLLLPEAGVDLSSFIASCNTALHGSGFSLELSTTKDALLLMQKKDTDPASTEVGRIRVITKEEAKKMGPEKMMEMLNIRRVAGALWGNQQNCDLLIKMLDLDSTNRPLMFTEKTPDSDIVKHLNVREETKNNPLTKEEKMERRNRWVEAIKAFGPTCEEFCMMGDTNPMRMASREERGGLTDEAIKMRNEWRMFGMDIEYIYNICLQCFFQQGGKVRSKSMQKLAEQEDEAKKNRVPGFVPPLMVIETAAEIYGDDDPIVALTLKYALSENPTMDEFVKGTYGIQSILNLELTEALGVDLVEREGGKSSTRDGNTINNAWAGVYEYDGEDEKGKPRFKPKEGTAPARYGRSALAGDFIMVDEDTGRWWVDVSELHDVWQVGKETPKKVQDQLAKIMDAFIVHKQRNGTPEERRRYAKYHRDVFTESALTFKLVNSTDSPMEFAEKITIATLADSEPEFQDTVDILGPRFTLGNFLKFDHVYKEWNIVWPWEDIGRLERNKGKVVKDQDAARILERVHEIMKHFIYAKYHVQGKNMRYNSAIGRMENELRARQATHMNEIIETKLTDLGLGDFDGDDHILQVLGRGITVKDLVGAKRSENVFKWNIALEGIPLTLPEQQRIDVIITRFVRAYAHSHSQDREQFQFDLSIKAQPKENWQPVGTSPSRPRTPNRPRRTNTLKDFKLVRSGVYGIVANTTDLFKKITVYYEDGSSEQITVKAFRNRVDQLIEKERGGLLVAPSKLKEFITVMARDGMTFDQAMKIVFPLEYK